VADQTPAIPKDAPKLELRARESVIRVGGHARLNPSNIKAAGLESPGPMRVRAGRREVVLTVVSDGTVGPDEVVIRAPDLRRLRVETGARVTVSGHELLAEAARRQAREAGQRVRTAARGTGKAARRARGRVKKARVKATREISKRARAATKRRGRKRSKGRKAAAKRGAGK